MDSTSQRAKPASSLTILKVSASVMRTSPQYLGAVSTSRRRRSTWREGGRKGKRERESEASS
jgi:hypothetical protein